MTLPMTHRAKGEVAPNARAPVDQLAVGTPHRPIELEALQVYLRSEPRHARI